MKLLSFSYPAGQLALIVKDPVHLPNHLPHRNKDPGHVLIRSEKKKKEVERLISSFKVYSDNEQI